MPKGIRRNYDEHFKTKVVLETLKGQKTLAQLSSEFGLHANQITEWKKQALLGFSSLFSGQKRINGATNCTTLSTNWSVKG